MNEHLDRPGDGSTGLLVSKDSLAQENARLRAALDLCHDAIGMALSPVALPTEVSAKLRDAYTAARVALAANQQ